MYILVHNQNHYPANPVATINEDYSNVIKLRDASNKLVVIAAKAVIHSEAIIDVRMDTGLRRYDDIY